MFSAAQGYERFMGRWSRALAPLLVQFAGLRDKDAVLDVGCGTGALTTAILASTPRSSVVGIDRSDAYVAFAREHCQDKRARFEVADAQQLPFAAASVDRTLSLLILNFVPDAGRALREMIRVTRPGGTIAAAIWDYGSGVEMLRLFWDEVAGLDLDAASSDERQMPLSRNGELAALWREHGLQSVADDVLTIETVFASFDDYWQPFLEKQGPAGAHVAAMSESERERLRLALRRRLLGDGPDRAIKLRARAWAVRGTVPARA